MRILSALVRRMLKTGPRPEAGQALASDDAGSLLERPPYSERARKAIELLPDLAPGDAEALVRGTLRLFLATVVDLPASERHHHSEPYGLAVHSAEVAELALRAAQSEHFTLDTRGYPEEEAYRIPRLRYAAWFFGLLHDSGKIAQVIVRGPKGEMWNPYLEPLAEFYRRHGRPYCQAFWRVGRGLDAHTWHNAYLIGRLLLPPVASYMGPTLVGEILEQQSHAAREVMRLVTDADRRSTREALARQAEAVRRHPQAPEEAPVLVGAGGGEYLDQIPACLARALSRDILHANDPRAEVLVGRRWILLRYPQAVAKLAILVREAAARECAKARALYPSEEGARELASYLHAHRKLCYDPETDAWKMKAKITLGASFDVADAILVERTFLEPAFRGQENLSVFPGEVRIARAVDGALLEIDGFRPPREAGGSAPAPADPVPATPAAEANAASVPKANAPPPKASPRPEKSLPPGPAVPPPPAPAVVALRKFISPEVLLQDIREAILTGVIPTNRWNKPCYVLEDVTYLASPKGFQCLVDRGLYARDPKREVNVYLDALSKVPSVRKRPGGRVLTQIAVRPGARPLWVVAFETKGLFRDSGELARVGYWVETPIRELSEEEARAARPPEVPDGNAIGVAHA